MPQRFETLDVALELIAALRPVLEQISRRDKDLHSQLRRAASSIPMNLSEGGQRVGKDKHHFYRIAAGSAAEVRTALKIAIAWGDLDPGVTAPAEELLDRVLAMLWRLTNRPR